MRACMLAYTFYETDNRVRRYAETLARRGDQVDVIALNTGNEPAQEVMNKVNIYRIQKRIIDERGSLSYLMKLLMFLMRSAIFVTRRHFEKPYELIHVHSVPDFEVFATLLPKLKGAKIVLDIHDLVPEFYASKFKKNKKSFVYKTLLLLEKLSSGFADHVIISNHIWWETIVGRSVKREKCTPILNYPDSAVFYPRPRTRTDCKFIFIYPGTINWHQGLDIAVRAFALISDKIPDAEFHIYGGDLKNNPLTKLIDDLHLHDRVFLKGFLPLDQIANVMASADLGIVPKRNDFFGGEAFSTKILEFMAIGVPLIVSRTKVDSYYFNDSVVQFFTPEDETDLAKCMLLLAGNKKIREKLAANASIFIHEYSWDNKKTEYLGIVDGLTCTRQ